MKLFFFLYETYTMHITATYNLLKVTLGYINYTYFSYVQCESSASERGKEKETKQRGKERDREIGIE